MTGTSTLSENANSGSSGFDWDFFKARTIELGGDTNEKRAALAGISVRTYYRLQNGEAALDLRELKAMAEKLGVTRSKLLGEEPS